MLWLVLAVIGLKLAMIVIVGPVWWPDSTDYSDMADGILHDSSWLHDAHYTSNHLGGLTFRMVGYPLIVAAAKALFGGGYETALIAFQSALSVGLYLILLAVVPSLLRFRGARVLITVLYMLSPMTIFDVSILSDSVTAVLVLSPLLYLLGAMSGAWRLRFDGAVAAGVMWAIGVLIRDAGRFFMIIPLAGVALWAVLDRGRGLRAVGVAACLVVPTVLSVAAYQGWNTYRTGESFLSTTGTNNWLRPVFELKARGLADPFLGDDAVDRAVRKVDPPLEWPGNLAVLSHILADEGLTPNGLQNTVKAKYVDTVLAHPLAYARLVLFHKYQWGDTAFIAFEPTYQLDYLVLFSTGYDHRFLPSSRDLRARIKDSDVGALLLLVGKTVLRAMALVLLVGFLAGGFVYLVLLFQRSGDQGRRAGAVVFCWLAFFAWSLMFALIHREDRHLLPVLPLAWLGILMMLEDAVPAARRRFAVWRGREPA